VNDGGAEGVLTRYFRLLDARDVDGVLHLWNPAGVMITRGGTGGEAVVGLDALRAFYRGRGPATARHTVTSTAAGDGACFAEGVVEPLTGDRPVKFFLASALLDGAGRIARYTTLVWADVDPGQRDHLVGRPCAPPHPSTA
jgi:hypothetical protein